MQLCYTDIDLGLVGKGKNDVNDMWFQPVGRTAFNPDVLRLVKTTSSLKSSKCAGQTYNYTDITYFTTIDDGDWNGITGDGPAGTNAEACAGNSQQITNSYCYAFVAVGTGSTTIRPYQEASSGTQQEYNGDFDGTTVTITTSGCSVSLVKSADKNNVFYGDKLTLQRQLVYLIGGTLGMRTSGSVISLLCAGEPVCEVIARPPSAG